ncbi:MAG: F0F1 ATP synthase subunit B [Dehalococcoidia bacterium]|jgi:F-type H+-transporting ATPase subunit b|nr:F0F1 ATP synthase subunit B [Dehalococcoidia bacterium]
MGAIGIDWQVLLAQFVNFAILFGLLSVLLYKPMRRMLDERSNKIKESMEQAEQIKEQMTKSEEQVKLQLDTARREGQDILAQAAQMGERLKEEAKGEARQEAEVIVARARTEIERERDQAIDEVKREFVDLAITAAEKVVHESLDREKHRRLIEEVLEQAPKREG